MTGRWSELDRCAARIQKCWRRYKDRSVFKFLKNLILLRENADPAILLRVLSPREAEICDAAAGLHVRLRLDGRLWPPRVFWKVFTHASLVDIGSFAPRDYASSYTACWRCPRPAAAERSARDGWYQRIENNGWRPIEADALTHFPTPADFKILDGPKINYHHNRLVRRQVLETRRREKQIQWMRALYAADVLDKSKPAPPPSDLPDKSKSAATSPVEPPADASTAELSADERSLLDWCKTLDYDRYVGDWLCSGASRRSEDFVQCSKEILDRKQRQGRFVQIAFTLEPTDEQEQSREGRSSRGSGGAGGGGGGSGGGGLARAASTSQNSLRSYDGGAGSGSPFLLPGSPDGGVGGGRGESGGGGSGGGGGGGGGRSSSASPTHPIATTTTKATTTTATTTDSTATTTAPTRASSKELSS